MKCLYELFRECTALGLRCLSRSIIKHIIIIIIIVSLCVFAYARYMQKVHPG